MCVACFTHETYINYNLNSLQMYQIKLNYVAKKILIKITTNKIYKKKLSHKYIDPACNYYEQHCN